MSKEMLLYSYLHVCVTRSTCNEAGFGIGDNHLDKHRGNYTCMENGSWIGLNGTCKSKQE